MSSGKFRKFNIYVQIIPESQKIFNKYFGAARWQNFSRFFIQTQFKKSVEFSEFLKILPQLRPTNKKRKNSQNSCKKNLNSENSRFLK
jgi:hypothetical protein